MSMEVQPVDIKVQVPDDLSRIIVTVSTLQPFDIR